MEPFKQTADLSVENILKQAWELCKKHLPIFILVFLIGQMAGGLFSYAYYTPYFGSMISNGGYIEEDVWIESLVMNGSILIWAVVWIVAYAATLLLSFYLNLVTYRMLHAAIEEKPVDLVAELKRGFHNYWFFFATCFVYGIITCVGTLFCIIPGIYLGTRLMFVPMLAANHPELGFSEIFSRSWQMSKGHFGEMLLLGIVAFLIIIAGMLCCCVGVLVAYPFIYMMLACMYKQLLPAGTNGEEETTVSTL